MALSRLHADQVAQNLPYLSAQAGHRVLGTLSLLDLHALVDDATLIDCQAVTDQVVAEMCAGTGGLLMEAEGLVGDE